MIKLRNLVAAALLTLCVGALNANAATTAQTAAGLTSVHAVTGTCWVFMGGRWWLIPC